MSCMKCGRETPAEQFFCEDCLLEMEKYPVKPDTAVLLPRYRKPSSSKKPAKHRTVNLEEQVKVLKRRVRHLTAGLILALLVIAALMYPSIAYFLETRYAPGQNYSTIITTTAPTEVTEAATIPAA